MDRGGIASFDTFRLDHHRPTDQRTDGRTDKASFRFACPRLKREIYSRNQEVKIFAAVLLFSLRSDSSTGRFRLDLLKTILSLIIERLTSRRRDEITRPDKRAKTVRRPPGVINS